MAILQRQKIFGHGPASHGKKLFGIAGGVYPG